MNDLVSIIIPAYNVEKYIHRAIESSVRQTHKKIEVIIVDDGSTDRTCEIITEYAARYPEIKHISQTNAGVSSARNAALEICNSDYVIFLDSDDWLEENAIERLLCKSYDQNLLVCCDRYFAYYDTNNMIYRISQRNINRENKNLYL